MSDKTISQDFDDNPFTAWDGTEIIPGVKAGGSPGGLQNGAGLASTLADYVRSQIIAADAAVTDAGGYFTGTDAEAVLQEIGAQLATLSASTDADTDELFTSDTSSTADSDPGNGVFKWNNATQASATALYIDNQTAIGVSLTTYFASLPQAGYIHLVQNDDATKWQLWKWTATPTAGTGYYKFTNLTLMASGGSIGNGKSVSVAFQGRTEGAVTTSGLTMSTNKVLARSSASTGAIEEKSLSDLLDFIGSAAQGDILYRGASAWARLAAGTAGQFLKTQGTGANPVWADEPFDVHAFYPGIPTASAKVLRVPIARAVTFPGNFSGSYFAASANATATTVFDVQKNGSSIGSISIAAGGTVATFTTTSGTAKTFAAGDVLAIIAPATPDATLADPGFVLAGTR